ncbi:hypothetical protein IGI04_014690 [Brassica rapa subsp. trilocularis]|uniref:Uncharacterized protein n=1 Tax=Brassica rapa subsp. trilocularis TaxID=1813537 RepID=A0ABQ7MMX4_BRACM|nr:hypothetical protein IGI04_014690 [Brassica rapa subsp. trilocularis]
MMQRFSDKYFGAASKMTKIGQASMNQDLMVVATKPCSLLFDLYPRILCEASLEDCRLKVPFKFFNYSRVEIEREKVINESTQGVTFQTCLKNLIPCIPNPKTSNYVKFSVRGQLWFLQTIKENVYS